MRKRVQLTLHIRLLSSSVQLQTDLLIFMAYWELEPRVQEIPLELNTQTSHETWQDSVT